MSTQLSGRVAVVTGSSKGIGAAIAQHLAAAGASVVINYHSHKTDADKIVRAITAKGGKAIAVQANVSRIEDVQKLFAATIEAFGQLDILVNNAGVYEFFPLETVTTEHFHKLFDLNVLGLLLTTQEAVKHFPPTGGSIINISSIVTKNPMPGTVVYSATKASVDMITRILAKELGPKKIRVNALNPGITVTEGVISTGIINSDFHRQLERETPLGRIAQPQDIASVALFLASDDSGWITGETLEVSGGY